jgi:hypothetical protein
MSFSDDANVVVKQLDDRNWEVRQGFAYRGQADLFEVPVGQRTDFASVPRVFVWLLPRYGRYTLAAILHDYLWRERAAKCRMDYIDADGTFRRAMRELDVPFLKRWTMWAAVRWGAVLKPHGRRHWLRESWRVVPLTILVLPIVIPPAAIIIVALVVFEFVEAVIWVPLRLSFIIRSRLKRPTKQVNRPELTWRL